MKRHLFGLACLIARAMLSATFIISALRHLLFWQSGLDEMQQLAMPRSSLLLLGSVALRLAGGTMVLVGFRARIGGILLALFVLPAAFMAHNFWAFPADRQLHESVEFLNNLSMAGGALLVATLGPGAWSFDLTLRPDHGLPALAA